jgi:hypothetical protein
VSESNHNVSEHDGVESAGASSPQLPAGPSSDLMGNFSRGGTKNWGVPTQLAVLALLLGVSVSAILAMRHFATNREASIKQIKIDYPLDAITAAQTAEQTRVLTELKKAAISAPVSYERLNKNPFSLSEAEETIEIAQDDSLERALHEKSERERALKAEVASVQLQAVMGGTRPLARVNGQMLKVGDKLGQFLTIAAIHGRSIEVAAEGQTFVVEMAEASTR